MSPTPTKPQFFNYLPKNVCYYYIIIVATDIIRDYCCVTTKVVLCIQSRKNIL